MAVRLSVCLSVLCLTLSREWKDVASLKVAGRRSVTCDPHLEVRRSKIKGCSRITRITDVCDMKGQRSR